MLIMLINLINKLPSLTIVKDGLKYLTRYFVFGADRRFGNVFIHHFHRSDMDKGLFGYGLLHSHPWTGLSFVLTGGYREERLMPDGSISVKLVKPFTFNYGTKDSFHRVDLFDEAKGCWTIFFTGPRFKKVNWFFYDRVSKRN